MFIAVDFDGTIVDHLFPAIGKPSPGAFKWLKRFQAAGAQLVLWTMRSDSDATGPVLTDAVEFCLSHGIEFHGVNENPQPWTTSAKAYAHVYIDDAAIGCPMIENKRAGGRPMVDWEKVGPAVLELIKVSKQRDNAPKPTRRKSVNVWHGPGFTLEVGYIVLSRWGGQVDGHNHRTKRGEIVKLMNDGGFTAVCERTGRKFTGTAADVLSVLRGRQ